jgi:hypothetical protein
MATVKKYKNYKKGDRVKVVGNTSGSNYAVGRCYTVQSKSGSNYMLCDPTTGLTGNWIMPADLALASVTRKALLEEKAELEGQINQICERLAYMETVGSDVFDEDEYKIHRAIGILDATKNPADRVKALAKLIKGIL